MENVSGTPGPDDLKATSADTRLAGGAGDDVLRGGKGNDILIGGAGDDIMSGGAGADQFRFIASLYEGDGGADTDRIVDLNFSEGDWLVFENYADGTWEDAPGLAVFDADTDAIVSSWTGLVNLVEGADNVTATGNAGLNLLVVRIEFDGGKVQEIRITNGYDDYVAAGGTL